MKKILSKKFKIITLMFGILIVFTGCNTLLESDDNTTVKNSEVKIPSFSDITKEKIGCKQENNTDEECSEDKTLSVENMILESLIKKLQISSSSETIVDDRSVAQSLTSLVEDSEPKKRTNTKESLALLVASVSDFADADEKSIGTFDIEKFSSTWQELQSLVDDSEDTKEKQKSLRKNLEVLVVSASTDDENIERVELKVKALLDISSKASSVQETKFSNAIMSDMSHKTIDLLEANDQWIKIKIRSGDTLSSYAEKYYGDPNKYRIIYEANRDVIAKDYIIYVGSILKIPTLNSIQGI